MRPPLFPRPGTLGIFIILIIVLAFTAGQIKNELGLKLLGVIFSCVLAWCFLSVFILGLIHRKKALSLAAYIVPGLLNMGEPGEIRFPEKNKNSKFFYLPGALIRYEMKLETRDRRRISCIFNPSPGYGTLTAKERGAYYSAGDRFFISDVPGFFRLSFPLSKETGPRLLVIPSPAEDRVNPPIYSEGIAHRAETNYNRTDDLTDHRPYVPGDDPRRINWKLYSHGTTSELFVREGEYEPPPHGSLIILTDTQADGELFTLEEGRRAVDLLCGAALEAALDFSSRGIEVFTGYTGGGLSGGSLGKEDNSAVEYSSESQHHHNTQTALAASLAYPACLPLSSPDELPKFRGSMEFKSGKPGVLIFALPRVSSMSSAIDRFLQNREAGEKTTLFFLYEAGSAASAEWQKAADLCEKLYRRKPGLNVRSLSV